MLKNKQNLLFLLAGIAVLIFVVAAILFLVSENNSDIALKEKLSVPADSRVPQNQHSSAENSITATAPPESKPDLKPSVPKVEALKQSEDLDMTLVDASLREYMHSLYYKFRKAKNKEEFMALLEAELMKEFPEETAKKLLQIYKAYMDCELRIQERLISYEQPKSEEDMLFIADDMFAFRVEQLGEELAEKLYGQEYRMTKYKILNKKIYDDPNLYGAEKEMQLRLLAAEIFGENADDNIYNKTGEGLFREKLGLYKKDFSEMSEAEKKEKKREFRLEYLSPEDVDKIEAAEAVVAANRQKDLAYGEKEKAIRDNPALSETEKQEKIRAIQDEFYGDRAEKIRRGEAFAREHNEKLKKILENSQYKSNN